MYLRLVIELMYLNIFLVNLHFDNTNNDVSSELSLCKNTIHLCNDFDFSEISSDPDNFNKRKLT